MNPNQLQPQVETPNIDGPMGPVFETDKTGDKNLVGFQNFDASGVPTGTIFTPEQIVQAREQATE
jgi:hypothetical protein